MAQYASLCCMQARLVLVKRALEKGHGKAPAHIDDVNMEAATYRVPHGALVHSGVRCDKGDDGA